MPFASGNKKTNNAYDQRTAGADDARVASFGGLVFTGGSSKNKNTTPLSTWIALGALGAVLIWAAFFRK